VPYEPLHRRELIRDLDGYLHSPDPITVVVRGHVSIEAAMNDAIRAKMHDRDAFDKLKLKFGNLVHLSSAIGIVSSRWSDALFQLDSLRNYIAHEVGAAVSHERIVRLWESLPPRFRDNDPEDDAARLRKCIAAFFLLFHAREAAIVDAENDRKAAEVVESVLRDSADESAHRAH
jgi:hypothetical protein